MKKGIWIIFGAALLAAAVLLLLLRPVQSPASSDPTLPTPFAGPDKSSDAPMNSSPAGTELVPETEQHPSLPEISEDFLDPVEDSGEEHSSSSADKPGSDGGGSGPDSPASQPVPDSSAEAPSAPATSVEPGAPETSLPAYPGGSTGFPILPPDIFPKEDP